MNAIERELKASLVSAESVEPGTATLAFHYPESLTAFRGHFPGDPILPGICILQSLRIGMESLWQQRLRLTEVTNAKFIAPAQPNQTLIFGVRESNRTETRVTVKAKVTSNEQRIAELTVSMEVLPA